MPRGRERRPGPPGKAALQDAALVSASCPSARLPHQPACGFTLLRAGRRSRVGGGGAGRLRPRGWAPRDVARGVVGGLRGFSRACASPLSFPEGASLQGQRDLCLPCGAGSHREVVGDASAWCSGTHTVCVPQVQCTVQFKAPREMSVSIAWGGEGVGRAQGWAGGHQLGHETRVWPQLSSPQPTWTWGPLFRPPVPPARHPHPVLLLPALLADLGEGPGSCRLGLRAAPHSAGCALSCFPAMCHLRGQLAPPRGAGGQAAGLNPVSSPARFLLEA